MKNNRHSDLSLSAKGSKVAAASQVEGITMKVMKSDPFSRGDGEGVEGAIHGSPEEGSRKKIFPIYLGNRLRVTKRSSQHDSPSSSEASSPLSRKKKRSKRIHLVPVVKHLLPPRSSQYESSSSSEVSSPLSRRKKRSKRVHLTPVVQHLSRTLSPPSNADALSRKKNAIKSTAIARVLPKHSRGPEPSNTDGEAQSTYEASASLSREKKLCKRVLDIASNSSSGLSPRNEALSAEEIGMPKQKKSDHSPANQRGSNAHRAGDVSINKADSVEPAHKMDPPIGHSHALVVDNCLDANPRMDKLIPPARRGSSSSRIESTWTQEKKVDTPTSSTEEKPPLLRVPKESFQLPTSEKQGPDAEAIENLLVQISSLKCKLNKVPYYHSICDERQQVEVYQRLSRYYIQAHELPSPGDNALLSKELERCLNAYEIYFLKRAKDNPEWYFHPEQCKLAGLEDYQRLVLRDDPMYGELKRYRLYYHTYQGDVEYVQFREQMAEQIKWIDDEQALFGDQRLRNELEAFIQTLRIAIQFPNISGRSVVSALHEHLYSLRFDFDHRKDLDGVYLEIWKSVAKNKVNFREALSKLYEEDIFPFRRPYIKLALDTYPGPSWIKSSYDTYVDGIDERFSEEEAHPLIIEAVERMVEKRKSYLDYAKKKLEIAARIGLKKSNLEVTAQGGDSHGEGKASIVS